MTIYRTKTYIAGDWDHDEDAVNKLHQWNDSNHWSLTFTDAHELTQANDSSLNCSIKASLKKRMDASKRFVLIVGDSTKTVTAGSCVWCGSYNSHTYACAKGHSVDYRSYIKYECDKAVEAEACSIIKLHRRIILNLLKPKSCSRFIRSRASPGQLWRRIVFSVI